MAISRMLSRKMAEFVNDAEDSWTVVQHEKPRQKNKKQSAQVERSSAADQDDQPDMTVLKRQDQRGAPAFIELDESILSTGIGDEHLAVARSIIETNNGSRFKYFIDPLRVEAVKSSKPAYVDLEEVRELAFIARGDMMLILSVKLAKQIKKSKTSSSQPVLLCRVWNEWKSFSEYIEVFRAALEPTAMEPKIGEEGWKQQQSWWSGNNKAFRLMDLPAELRIMILKKAIGHRFYPLCHTYKRRESFWYSGEGYELSKYGQYEWSDPYKEVVCRLNVKALLAHPKLYYEMEHYIHYETQRGFETISGLQTWIRFDQRHAPGGIGSLQHLQLDFSLEAYIKFFGVSVAPFHLKAITSATVLQEFSNLRSLELRFRSPLNGATDDPWGGKGHFRGFKHGSDFQGNRPTNYLTACQKVIVDWILTFAKQCIEHIPRILLTGCIKTSTKTKWQSILSNACEGVHLGLDIEAAKEKIRNWPVHDLPPSCHCSSLCAYSGASVSNHLYLCATKALPCATCSNLIDEPDDGSQNFIRTCHLEDYEFDFED